MTDSGVWIKPYVWSWRSHDRDQVVHAAIIHVAGADMDAAYGAYVAAEKITSGDIAQPAGWDDWREGGEGADFPANLRP